jgi:hypothetical protein
VVSDRLAARDESIERRSGSVMQTWSEFFSVMAGASATLLGLLFVSVSINATKILSEQHRNSKRLAEQAFQNYLAVLMVSLLALFPSLKPSELGASTLAVTIVWSVWVLVRLYQALIERSDSASRIYVLRRQIMSILGFGLLTSAAYRMASGHDDTRNTFAAANILLLFSATTVSWQLLLKLATAGTEN